MADSLTRYVHVKSIRDGKFVEFDFSINDDTLSVELIMPFAAFEEFCTAQHATVSFPEGGAKPPCGGASPGLYRQPDQYQGG
jgi:hypothetical protein